MASKYEQFVKPNLDKISEMALTMTELQIAETLGISFSSFRKYKRQYDELANALKKGRKELAIELKSVLIKKAKGYYYEETKTVTQSVKWPDDIYIQLIRAGFTREQIAKSEIVKTEVNRKYAQPDANAINLLLKNCDDYWQNDPKEYELKKKSLELQEKKLEQGEW